MKPLIVLLSFITICLAFTKDENVWLNVKNKTVLDIQSAHTYNSFDAKDAESVVRYFYSSLIQKNSNWRNTCHKLESEWTTKMKNGMNTYAQITFKKVRLLKYCNMFEDQINFSVYIEGLKKGKAYKTSGEIILQTIDKKWTVIEVK